MFASQRQEFSRLSPPRLRDNATLSPSPNPQKRPRVQMRHPPNPPVNLPPQPNQTHISEPSFSFYADAGPSFDQQPVPFAPIYQSPTVHSAVEKVATNNAPASHPSSSEPLISGFRFVPTDSQPVQPPLLNASASSNPSVEVISLDDDDLGHSHQRQNPASPQLSTAEQPQSNVQPEVIDLDDDEALAQLQPLTNTQTRLHISRGGGLFRVQSSGQLEIVDSDDEEELTTTHRLVAREDGLHTLSNTPAPVQHPITPTVQQSPLSSNRHPAGDQHQIPARTTPMIPYSNNETPQPLQTTPAVSDFYFSAPTITNWPQPNMRTHMSSVSSVRQQLPSAFPSSDMFTPSFARSSVADHFRYESPSVLTPFPPTVSPSSGIVPSAVVPQSGTTWLNARSPHALRLAQERLALAHAAASFSSPAFPAAATPSATGVPPTQIIHQIPPLPTGNETYGGSLRAAEADGISAEGLRNLIKQNSLTADATEEAATPSELNVSLMPHQRRALHWMAKREIPVETDEDISAVDEQCLGGILADDQGLGKTLTMIGLLLKNRPGRGVNTYKRTKKRATSDESIDLEDESNEEDEDESILLNDDRDFVPPDRSEDAPWKTLIVCPLSVINQWKEELSSRIRADCVPRVCVYHGPKRERRPSVLENCDVVITTYSTLVTEYPKVLKEHPEFMVRKKGKLPLPTRAKGPLCRVSWNRVVLDEAQHVKNRGTDSWSAVMSLESKKRWCLTGTPIQNSVDDIYSLFCFIRYKFVPNYETWNTRWKKNLEHSSAVVRERTFKRFQTIVGVVLLRRTKNDTIKGAPLITLPKRLAQVETPEFVDKEEEDVYRAVQEKSVLTFNKFLVAGTLANNYSSVLLVLLRLRQACSHPFLIEYAGLHGRGRTRTRKSDEVATEALSTCYSQEDLEEAMELVVGGHSLLSMIDDAARQRVKAALMPPAKGITPTRRISCQYCQRNTPWSQGSFLACGDLFCPDCCHLLRREGKCLRCLSTIEDPNTSEVFISADDLRKEIHAEVILSEDRDKGINITASQFKAWFQLEVIKRRSGSSSDTVTPDTTDVEVEDVNEDDDDDGALDQLEKMILEKKTKTAYGGIARTSCPEIEAQKEKLLRALSQHSTKVRKILEKLNEIREQDPNEKTLIFSQWTSMLDIIEFHVQLEGHEVCRLDGSMTLTARQREIDAFRASPTKNIFLISLHAGGTGLNLTAANNVIIADVWWNPAVEEQAIDRAHRIGQTKDVRVTRFKMKGTVEERIYSMCARKREASDGTLGVTGAQSLGRKKLSLQELMHIFGGAAQDVAQSARKGSAAAEAANNILSYQRHSS